MGDEKEIEDPLQLDGVKSQKVQKMGDEGGYALDVCLDVLIYKDSIVVDVTLHLF